MHAAVSGKRRSHRLLLLCLIVGCDGSMIDGARPSSPDDSQVPQDLRALYRDDAARLALREILDENGPASAQVELPESRIEPYYEALIRIFNFQHPARNAVIERYEIHTFPSPSVRELHVHAIANWADAWGRGEVLTGNADVDALVTAYDLRVTWHYLSGIIGHLVRLESPLRLNMEALGTRFEEIEGVSSAGDVLYGGDGNDITAEVRPVGLLLEFSVGFGDCPSGCSDRHFWSFLVRRDGAVEFLGSRGPTPP